MERKAVFPYLLFLTLISTVFIFPAFCQQESLTITTYYPAPFGVYQNLRLFPIAPEPAANCTADTEGNMYYNNATHQVTVCGQDANGAASWQAVGLWDRNGNDIFPSDNTLSVGIGTDTPQDDFIEQFRGSNFNVSAKGIKLGLEKNGGGRLMLLNNNTPPDGDNNIYFEGFSTNGAASANAMFFTGMFGENIGTVQFNANDVLTRGRIKSITKSNFYNVPIATLAALHPDCTVDHVNTAWADWGICFPCIAAASRWCSANSYSSGTIVEFDHNVDIFGVACIP
jgi:hypothetical protein